MTNKTYASTIIGLKHTGRSFTSGVGNSVYPSRMYSTAYWFSVDELFSKPWRGRSYCTTLQSFSEKKCIHIDQFNPIMLYGIIVCIPKKSGWWMCSHGLTRWPKMNCIRCYHNTGRQQKKRRSRMLRRSASAEIDLRSSYKTQGLVRMPSVEKQTNTTSVITV